MHLHFERNTNTKCDCSILSLSWMGKVPEELPEEEGWKLNRTNYYQEGWLATGNIRGIVGVTFTTSHCKKNIEYPLRTNYNLRGHRSDVILVKWNEPYQKLASCDSSGIIFVWIKYEGRWSVELINDRNTPVTHFSWSHDGRMALICYQDGFVLVGSVAGQRYWSSMLNLDATISCGIWTPDDQQVYFGTTQGQIIVMDVHGAMVSQVQLCSEIGITAMAWSCEKFKMEEGEDTEPGVTNASKRSFVLAVSFHNGYIYLLKSYDDVSPIQINTGMNGLLGFAMEWSNSRELLAVAGTEQDSIGSPLHKNLLKFYTESGILLYTILVPNNTSPVSALTWGHNDKRLFIATGQYVHIAWVSRKVASLQLFCRLQIQSSLVSEAMLPKLPLPSRIKALIGNLFAQTIRCCVPNLKCLREFVSRPPVCSTRLHCTMIRHDDEANQSSGTCYTLYLEFLGGLVPLLKGKRTSKIRPEFVIFDPQVEEHRICVSYSSSDSTTTTKSSSSSSTHTATGNSASSESELDDGCRSPRMQRKRKTKVKKRANAAHGSRSPLLTVEAGGNEANSDELAYLDTLPEHAKLVEVTSNIWGTKFKIHGLAKTLPANLGQVTYKTSLLHLQPRQMTLIITELRDSYPTGPDPNFNPNIFSEDEEELQLLQQNLQEPVKVRGRLVENAPPIAPMSPRPNRFPTFVRASSSLQVPLRPYVPHTSPLAKAESYEDESDVPDSNTASGSGHLENGTVSRSKQPESSSSSTSKPGGSSYSSFVGHYSRSSSSSSSNQSRVAVSPLYCEGSVPTLQSPKNAVAPIGIFDRPPSTGQTTLMSYSSSNDYTNNVVQVKNALISSDHSRPNSHVNPVPLNLSLNLEKLEATTTKSIPSVIVKEKETAAKPAKKRELKYIDEDTPTSATGPNIEATVVTASMPRAATVISLQGIPESITRSCSVGYLDNVEIVPNDVTLSMLRRDTPHKRLVLVDKKRQRKNRKNYEDRKLKLKECGKSKSLDLNEIVANAQPGSVICSVSKKDEIKVICKQMPKLNESSENDTDQSSDFPQSPARHKAAKEPVKRFRDRDFNSLSFLSPILCRKEKVRHCGICKERLLEPSCSACQKRKQSLENNNDILTTELIISSKPPVMPKSKKYALDQKLTSNDTIREGCGSNNFSNNNNNNNNIRSNSSNSTPPAVEKKQSRFRRNMEIVTSFTDSPLFSRKYRAANNDATSSTNSANTTPILGRRFERRAKAEQLNLNNIEVCDSTTSTTDAMNNRQQVVEATVVEQKSSISLHTQALTTLENIISRLRDLDEGRSSPMPQSPQHTRSSPTSPAMSKKSKRHQSASPIRNILNSPLLSRRLRRNKNITESSDEENNQQPQVGSNSGGATSEENGGASRHYKDLETFQKAQLRQKLKRGKIEPNGVATVTQPTPVRREFVLHNKAPMWNENSQVYQLDFGGRVTQESAKNFQIEFRGKQVMQFGRIDGNAYTLDFQYPFSALQAFAVALANVTQRLK